MSVMAMSEGGSSRQAEGTSALVHSPRQSRLSILGATWHVGSPNSLYETKAPSHAYTSNTASFQSTRDKNVSIPQSQLRFYYFRLMQRRAGSRSSGHGTELSDRRYHPPHSVTASGTRLSPPQGDTNSCQPCGGLFFARPSDPSTGPPALLAE